MPYSSSLTDKEWEIIAPLLPKKQKTRPPTWTKRQILDGVFYQLKNGCNWGDLPKDLPPYKGGVLALQTLAFGGCSQWDSDDVTFVGERTRQKKPQWTRLLIVDSQAVKNTCNASVESKGFCHYKCTNGIKRHLAVDTLGLPFFNHCTKASVSDDQGLIELLSRNLNYFRVKPVNIAKITILLDHGYHPETICKALACNLPAGNDQDSLRACP